MPQRIKGQEVEAIIIVDGAPQRTITAIRSIEVAFQLEMLSEGYLGETTNRRDALFRGVRGRMEMHMENADVFTLIQKIIERARNRQAGTRINVKATLRYPNGDRPRVVIPDVEFGEIPMNFASRSDYGTVSLDFEAQEAQVVS